MIFIKTIKKETKGLKVDFIYNQNGKIDHSNVIYRIVDDYSYLAQHISVMSAGGITFGFYGAAIGLGFSILDDLRVYNGYLKERTITQAFIGFALGYNVYPQWTSGVIGVVGSIMINQDLFKRDSNCFDSIMISAGFGLQFGGLSGALIGTSLGGIDFILVQYGITSKFYLSYGMIGVASSTSLLGKSITSRCMGVILGLTIANNYNTISFIKPVEIGKDLYNLYAKIIPQDELDKDIKSYAEVLLSAQIIMNQLRIILLKYQQNIMYRFEHMDDSNNNPIYQLTSATIRFAIFILPYSLTEFMTDMLNNFFATKLYISIDDGLRKYLFFNETALKLSSNKNNTVLIDNLRSDSKIIARDGSKLIIDYTAKSLNGFYGTGVLLANIPGMMVYSVSYNKVTEYISNFLAEFQNKYEILIKEQESKISNLYKHDMLNIKIISETGGALYSYNHLQSEYEKLRESELIRDQVALVVTAWKSFESLVNFIYTYYLIGYKVGSGVINFDNRINIHYSCLQVSSLLAWNGEKSQEIKIIYQSIERLNLFLDKTIFNKGIELNNIDSINRTKLSNNKLVIENLNIIVAEQKLLHINYLELECGKSYVIKGPSGSGKSSFVSKLIGVINNNIGGDGNVYYPESTNITLLTQQTYFPLYKTFTEIIFYPKQVDSNKILLLEELLTIVDLIQFNLDQVEDWYNVLSGGQKQKVKIISAIIHEPNILILDEVFNGLDKDSVYLMQLVLKEKLSDSLFISIDHNILENNKTGFYNAAIEVINGEIIIDTDSSKHNMDDQSYIYKSFEEIVGIERCYYYENYSEN